LERAAEHGNAEAQYEMGMALREGRDVVQNYEGAFKWLQLAAENGNARAQFEFGYMYRLGMGIAVDNFKAYVWFNLAAARGNADAVRARDAVLPLLSRSEVVEAQNEALRRNAQRAKPSTEAR
jgi:TPR repeat protein